MIAATLPVPRSAGEPRASWQQPFYPGLLLPRWLALAYGPCAAAPLTAPPVPQPALQASHSRYEPDDLEPRAIAHLLTTSHGHRRERNLRYQRRQEELIQQQERQGLTVSRPCDPASVFSNRCSHIRPADQDYERPPVASAVRPSGPDARIAPARPIATV